MERNLNKPADAMRKSLDGKSKNVEKKRRPNRRCLGRRCFSVCACVCLTEDKRTEEKGREVDVGVSGHIEETDSKKEKNQSPQMSSANSMVRKQRGLRARQNQRKKCSRHSLSE